MKMFVTVKFWIGVCILPIMLRGMNSLFAQAPRISYGAYKIFTKDSAIIPLIPVNKGGEIPNTIYSNTQTFAGSETAGFMDGAGRKAKFNRPAKIAVDKNGNLYVSDELNNRIRKISPDGMVSTLAGSGKAGAEDNVIGTKASFNGPSGIVVDQYGNVFVADVFNHKIRKISPAGSVSTYAGNGQPGFADNSNGLKASFHFPVDLTVDAAGNLFVTDEANNRIRKITLGRSVSTFAGSGYTGSFDNKVGEAATFNQPNGIAIDERGNLYIADQLNHKIRKITPSGVVTTLAGSGAAGSSDNVIGTMASFNNPRGVAVDKAGNIYVGDVANQKIRKISITGAVTTISGSGAPGSQDNTAGSLAGFYFPNGLTVDKEGHLFVSDALNNKIRIIELKGYSISPELLPAGLQFDRTKGVLTGTPTETLINSNYTITAYNIFGSSSANLSLCVSSQPGHALNFDGVDDRVFVPDAACFHSETVTVELWVKMNNLNSKFGRVLLKRNDLPGYDDSYSIGIDSNYHFTAAVCSGSGTRDGQRFAKQKDSLKIGQWYFVSAVFTKDSVSLYLNGKHEQSTFTGFPLAYGNSFLSLGFDERMNFSLDEVRIFNTDRRSLFREDMTNTLSPVTQGLVAYYNFNIGRASGDNVGFTNLVDLTDNNNNGTLVGFQLAGGDLSNWTESYAMVVPVVKEATHISDNGFVAEWEKPRFGEVNQYRLDVSTDRDFHTYVDGFHDLPVNGYNMLVKGLLPNTVYYYRVQAEDVAATNKSAYSNTALVKTNH